jgi:hypothetical protein
MNKLVLVLMVILLEASTSWSQEHNEAVVQPFYFWQLGKGTYLRGAPIWAFDMENDSYSTPLALGIGKVVKTGNTVFNLSVEPQYSVLHKGTQPQFQVFTFINLQFINKSGSK